MSIIQWFDGYVDGFERPFPAIKAGITGKPEEVTSGGAYAYGQIVFTQNFTAGDTVTIGGTVFTCMASGAAGNQFDVGVSLTLSLDSLVTVLNASTVPAVAVATDSKVSTTTLKAIYDTRTTVGNALTLAATVASGTATVTAMANGALDVEIGLESEFTKITTTGITPAQYYTLPDGVEGQKKTIHLYGKGTGNVIITPTTATRFTSATFDADKEYITCQFFGGQWNILVGVATVATP
jgi:hypothetical protein